MNTTINNESNEGANGRIKSINLFKFLQDISRLKSPIIRDINSYDKVLWLSDLPKEPECFTLAWGAKRSEQDETWLEIKKPNLRPFPKVSKDLESWVNEAELANSTQTPNLRERILAPERVELLPVPSNENTPQFIELKDSVHIQEQWGEYLREWELWAKENERAKKIQDVYAKLHAIYQEHKKRGESYEIILGIGLLTWLTPSNQQTKRHLITAQASIELDSAKGTLRVLPGGEGAKTTLEQDMLEIQECPNPDDQLSISKQVAEVGDEIWNIPLVKEILSRWVYVVSAEGKYYEDLEAKVACQKHPSVSFAPALILRKRSERGYIKAFEEVISQLNSGINIPIGIERVVEIKDDHLQENNEDGFQSDESIIKSVALDNVSSPYFPLPFNDEQLKIVKSLQKRQGILVQGPPGTGKSHTIANLICHLLAEGKRVLVTSQTPRALNVLKSKVPKEIRSLCVSLLGNSSNALKEMQDSVQGITDKQFNWDAKQNEKNIELYKKELDDLRRSESELNLKLRELREQETYEHFICEGKYKGTAQKIAEQIKDESIKHEWLDLEVEQEIKPPLTDLEILELLALYREVTNKEIREVNLVIVPTEKLPTTDELIKAKEKESTLKTLDCSYKEVKDSKIYESLARLTSEELTTIKKAFTLFLDARANLLAHRLPFVKKLVEDVIAEHDRLWKVLLDSSKKYLNGLMNLASQADDMDVKLPPEYSTPETRQVIMANIEALLKHLQNKGNLGIPGFRPKVVKEGWYLLRNTRINGKLCNNIELLCDLQLVLNVDDKLDKLWSFWSPYVEKESGKRSIQVAVIEDFCEPLEAAVSLYNLMVNAREWCNLTDGLPQPSWHLIEEVEKYKKTIEAVETKKLLSESQSFFNQLNQLISTFLAKPNVHPIVLELNKAISDRSEKDYERALGHLLNIEKNVNKLNRRNHLHEKLSKSAIDLATSIRDKYELSFWDENLSHFSESWKWAQANTWLNRFTEGVNEIEIVSELEDVQDRIRETTCNLASCLSWKHCLERLKEKERQHLRAWVQEIRSIGAGTGKHAARHRRIARTHMEQCTNAIPAWIMPLYRVVESVRPTPNTFDVVIVDEASQSGPESMILMFLAKQIIVVGDDEQISPDNIGIQHDDFFLLHERYLKDLPEAHKTALGPVSSLFDLADVLFGGRIILQEHFRCMPEIIQFSNNLCYTHKPLKPLRQYPPNRLEPIKVCHIRDGYREGEGARAINRPEAEAIVRTISQCCNDPAYKDKSMGVISLLGEMQAKLIEELLLKEIGSQEIERRNIICGDAYAFQGDERNIIFLSMVASPGEAMRAITSKPFKQRFNVAASRACDQLWLFHTPTLNDFGNKDCLRYKLLDYCLNPRTQVEAIANEKLEQLLNEINTTSRKNTPPKPFDSWFEIDVFLKILEKGYRIIPQFNVNNYKIDLVLEGMQGRLAVECDGDRWHSELEKRDNDMKRQRILERCGWKFWRVRGSEFYRDPELAMESLWVQLQRHGIAPGGRDVEYTESSNNKQDENEDPFKLSEQEIVSQSELILDGNKKALDYDIHELEKAIITILKSCPNYTCTKDSITSRVCSHLQVLTRGRPRELFKRRLLKVLNQLNEKKTIEEYKAKNVRIRLLQYT